jgi:tRNA (adenine57-N1/adenine58-N1)-methyltransferase
MRIKKILIRKPRKVVVDGKTRDIAKLERYNIIDDKKDYHMKHGKVSKKDFSKSKLKIKNDEYVLLKPSFIDQYRALKRKAQIMMLKDIAAIISETGVNKQSVVLDAGSGSGANAIFMAKIAKKVISYDINKENLEVTKHNVKELGIKNLTLKKGDVYKEVKEKNFDLFVIDVPEPWRVKYSKVVKKGGYVVAYTPSINQAQKFVKSLPDNFLYEKTVEIIEREWVIKDEVLRPKTKDVGHTAFLTFIRRII